jgi:gliding motility-associated-like protein
MCMPGVTAFIKRWIFVLAFGLLTGLPISVYAQLCTGSLGDPVVKIDFGAGVATHAGALAPGTTSYSYVSADFPNDGSYTIENSTAGSGNVWWSTTDHTGNAGGYMMVVNASSAKTDYFYRSTVTGLCAGTTFEFAAWAANLIRTQDNSPPDLTFTILKTDGVTKLATINTGTIPVTPGGLIWKQYGTQFTMPTGVSDVIVQITNNSPGGIPGNDLVLDDITFRPCGPVITSNFIVNNIASTTQVVCGSASQTVSLNSNVAAGVFINPVYQWQVNSGAGWANIMGATTPNYTFTMQSPVKGTYQYRMVSSEAVNSGSAACQVASNVLTLTVPDTPTASFVISNTNTSCLNSAVLFNDTSVQDITTWFWDFGDGQTSKTQNPTHTYATFGDYNVTLTVYNSAGCSSTITQRIHVTSRLLADFDLVTSGCTNSPITLTDRSTTADGTIAKWIWNFGDNSGAVTLTNNAPFTHTFTTSGTFVVSLEVISASGCVSDIFTKTVTVTAVDFTFCPGDITQFTDKTVKPGTPGYTYNWDFGDAASTTNTSTAQNPTHQYANAGSYTVTLTVSSPNGCAAAVKQKVVTSGITIANFDVVNKNNLCGSDSVKFVDKTDINSNINRLVWFYDIDNHPTDSVVITKNQMRSDKTYSHFYGPNNTIAPITYHALLIARIGGSCPDPTFTQDVVINPSPVAVLKINGSVLTDPYTLCQDAGAITIITEANLPGKPAFTGTGITSDGMFDPKISGIGTFTINYTYTADNTGCTYTTSFKIVVTQLPVIKLATTASAIEGGKITLNPAVNGSNLKYAWTPTTGISDPVILNPFFYPSVDTKYTLTVTTEGGCTSSADVFVSVLKLPVIPNTFTPNNDGYNDTWDIKFLNTYTNATVNIFNRYGEKVYSSIGYSIPWDGKFKGVALPFGVYYYIIDPKNGIKPMSGSLTIIK